MRYTTFFGQYEEYAFEHESDHSGNVKISLRDLDNGITIETINVPVPILFDFIGSILVDRELKKLSVMSGLEYLGGAPSPPPIDHT